MSECPNVSKQISPFPKKIFLKVSITPDDYWKINLAINI
jgi:hypothetical protein